VFGDTDEVECTGNRSIIGVKSIRNRAAEPDVPVDSAIGSETKRPCVCSRNEQGAAKGIIRRQTSDRAVIISCLSVSLQRRSELRICDPYEIGLALAKSASERLPGHFTPPDIEIDRNRVTEHARIVISNVGYRLGKSGRRAVHASVVGN